MKIAPPDSPDLSVVSQPIASESKRPVSRGRYHLVVLGSDAAGIAAALRANDWGARTALIEQNAPGGDRLNCGEVPLQALIRSARAVYDANRGAEFGYRLAQPPHVEFAEVMDRMRCLQAGLGLQHSAASLTSLGVDVYEGAARFTGRNSLDLSGHTIPFHRAVICTDRKPKAPSLAGLEEVGYLTRETIFGLTDLPRRLIVLGAGAFACEAAQAFRRFGSEVHLVSRSPELLAEEEPAATRIVREQFASEGVHLHLGWTATTAEKMGDSKSLILECRGEKKKIIADEILMAAGSQPNIAGLCLEQAGVDFMPQGIVVNDCLRTTNRAIFAAGEVAGHSHCAAAAEATAHICLQNALFFGWRRFSSLVVPRCTFTDPEVARVGLSAAEADRQGIPLDTYRADMQNVVRAVLDGDTQGFVQVHCRHGSRRILGATIVARGAGDLIGELSLAMSKRRSLKSLAAVNHCHPTQSEAFQRIAESYSRNRQKPFVARALQRYFSLWPAGGR